MSAASWAATGGGFRRQSVYYNGPPKVTPRKSPRVAQMEREEGLLRAWELSERMRASKNVTVYDTEDPDKKELQLCDGNTCTTIIVTAAALALLYLFSGKKTRTSKRHKASKRHSQKKQKKCKNG